MVGLTFIAGIATSLPYLKTGNSLSSMACQILVDSPDAIPLLLGH